MNLETLQAELTRWAIGGKRDAFLRWSAKPTGWTLSAIDRDTNRSFAWSGEPSFAGLWKRFCEWDGAK